MARTNIDIDDEACAAIMKRYGLSTKREAVNYALRSIAGRPMTLEEALAMQGTGWSGNLEEMRLNSPQLEAWLNRPADERLPGLEEGLPPLPEDDEVEGHQAP